MITIDQKLNQSRIHRRELFSWMIFPATINFLIKLHCFSFEMYCISFILLIFYTLPTQVSQQWTLTAEFIVMTECPNQYQPCTSQIDKHEWRYWIFITPNSGQIEKKRRFDFHWKFSRNLLHVRLLAKISGGFVAGIADKISIDCSYQFRAISLLLQFLYWCCNFRSYYYYINLFSIFIYMVKYVIISNKCLRTTASKINVTPKGVRLSEKLLLNAALCNEIWLQ